MLVFFPYKKLPYIFSHTKKCYVIHAHKKLPYKKNVSVFSTHTKKYYVIHEKKLLVFFPIQKNYYVVHAQKNCHTFFTMYFFPYKKLLCSAHIQKITSILTHKKLPYKKNVSVFSTHTKKLLVFFTIQKITMYYTHTKNCHTKKLLAFFPIQKITM